MVEPQNIANNTIKWISVKTPDGTRKHVSLSDLMDKKCCYTYLDGTTEKQFRGKISSIESRVDEPSIQVKLVNLLQDSVTLPATLYGVPGSDLRIDLSTVKYIE